MRREENWSDANSVMTLVNEYKQTSENMQCYKNNC